MIDTQAIRKKILDLALRGKLTEQLPEDGTAEGLYQNILKDVHTTIDSTLSENDVYEFDLPQSWTWVQLSSIVKKPIKRGKSPRYSETGETLVFAQKCNTKAGVIDLKKALKLDETTLSKYMLDDFMQDGDIVINSTGTGTLGRVGIYRLDDNPEKLPIVPDSHVTTIRTVPEIDCTYIFWCLKRMQPQLEGMGTGSTNQKELSASSLSMISIPLPPFSEQQRIVKKIGTSFSTLDTIDTLQSQYQDNLAALKSKIIDAGIQGKLTEQLPEDGTAEELYQQIQQEKAALEKAGKINKSKPLAPVSDDEILFDAPDTWKWVRLGEIIQFLTSGSRDWAKYYSDTGNIFLRMGNLSRNNFRLRLDNIQHVSLPEDAEGKLTSLQSGDLLFSITGEIGMLGLIPDNFGKAYINQHTAMIRFVDIQRNKYVPYLLLSYYAKEYFEGNQHGIKNSFNLNSISNMPIPLPPLAEQKRIVAKLEELLPLCEG